LNGSHSPAVPFGLAVSLLIVLSLIGLWDVYALWYLPPGSTVSYYLRNWSRELPALPMFVGLVLGHLFFPLPNDRPVQLPPPT